jgi:hypothetical protein
MSRYVGPLRRRWPGPDLALQNLYIKPKARTMTAAQREAVHLDEVQNRGMSTGGGEGRRSGNNASSAITSFKQRPTMAKSASAPAAARTQLAPKPVNVPTAAGKARPEGPPKRSLSSLSNKARFGY